MCSYHKEDEENYKRKALTAAKELGYDNEVVEKLLNVMLNMLKELASDYPKNIKSN